MLFCFSFRLLYTYNFFSNLADYCILRNVNVIYPSFKG